MKSSHYVLVGWYRVNLGRAPEVVTGALKPKGSHWEAMYVLR